MDFLENFGISEPIAIRIAATIVAAIVLFVLRWLIIRVVTRRSDDTEFVFRVRKAVVYSATALFVIATVFIWVPSLQDVATFLGLVSAGIAVALAPVVLDLAGWVFIIFRTPLRVGDRVEIDGVRGDVIDIRVMRFTLLEVGNWVDADQTTGRIVHVPNGRLFTTELANYTEAFRRVWHEVAVLITFESDWEKAERIVHRALEPYAMDEDAMNAEEDLREAAKQYLIHYGDVKPGVWVNVKDSGVELTGRVFVRAEERRAASDSIWRTILRSFAAEPDVTLAYPTVRTYLPDRLRIEGPPPAG